MQYKEASNLATMAYKSLVAWTGTFPMSSKTVFLLQRIEKEMPASEETNTGLQAKVSSNVTSEKINPMKLGLIEEAGSTTTSNWFAALASEDCSSDEIEEALLLSTGKNPKSDKGQNMIHGEA